MGDGEKLLTHLTSALKVLSGLDIFPRVPRKSLSLLTSVNDCVSRIYWVIAAQTRFVLALVYVILITGQKGD